MLKWIIQSNLIKPVLLQAFREAFATLQIDFEEVKVIPFSSELPSFTPSTINIFYGSTTLMLNAYAHQQFRNGVFYDPALFNTATYLQAWGDKIMNHDGKILQFKEFVAQMIHQKETWFIRPNEDDKSFAGKTMASEEISAWYERIKGLGNPALNTETLIFVAAQKSIAREWRNFIINGKVVSSTRYAWQGVLDVSSEDCPREMIDFVEECANVFSPHDIFVMDVAEVSNQFKIIECNCFNGTGFYTYAVKDVIKEVTERIMQIHDL